MSCENALYRWVTKGTEKRATKNMQFVLQHCSETSCKATLRVLPPSSNMSCTKSGCWQVWTWVVKRATSLFNSRFAAMSQNKLYVFCYPFFRTLTEFYIVSKGESGGSLRRKKKKKGKQKKIHDNVLGRRQPIDDLLKVKTNFFCRTVR